MTVSTPFLKKLKTLCESKIDEKSKNIWGNTKTFKGK